MKKDGVLKITLVLILLALLLYVGLFGVGFGIRQIKPMYTQLKEKSLGDGLSDKLYIVFHADLTEVEDTKQTLEDTVTVLSKRLEILGKENQSVILQGEDNIRVEMSGIVQELPALSEYLVAPAKLVWKDQQENAIITSDNIRSAKIKNLNNTYAIEFKLDKEGKQAYAEATKVAAENSEAINIYLDDKLISSPTPKAAITNGTDTISGEFSAEEIVLLTSQINSGVVPLHISEVEARATTTNLGERAFRQGILASAIALVAVAFCLLLLYKALGLASFISLVYYAIFTLFCMLTLPNVSLTLQGVAALILSFGMAVDTHVLVFEQINSEQKEAKSLSTSIDNGFKVAFRSVLDRNILLLLVAVALFIVGTAGIKSFAYTLGVGVLSSLLINFYLTRFIVKQLVKINDNSNLYRRNKRGGETA